MSSQCLMNRGTGSNLSGSREYIAACLKWTSWPGGRSSEFSSSSFTCYLGWKNTSVFVLPVLDHNHQEKSCWILQGRTLSIVISNATHCYVAWAMIPHSPKPDNPFKEVLHIFLIQARNMMHTIMAFAQSIISLPQPADYLVENGELWYSCDLYHWFQSWSLQMRKKRQSGQLPKSSSSSVLIQLCKSRNLVAERCHMTDLTCWPILPALKMVSQLVPCLVKTEYGEKGQRNFHAVNKQSISRDVLQAAAQSNHLSTSVYGRCGSKL